MNGMISKDTRVLVNVCLLAYNHKNYISQCIDSVLMQKTDFPFEIVLGEDESADGTREICMQYASKYPDMIRLFLRSRKDVIYINGSATGRFNLAESLKACRGKYTALLEGDDYWTDPLKLQKQVDFLEANPLYSTCFHRVTEFDEISLNEKIIPDGPLSQTMKLNDLLGGNNFIPTNSCVFWNFSSPLPSWFYLTPFGDYGLHLINAKRGDIGFIDEVMGVYRLSSSGVHGKLKSSNDGLTKAYQQHLDFWEIIRQTGEFDKDLVQAALNQAVRNLEYYQQKAKEERKPPSFANAIWKGVKARILGSK